LAVPVPFIAKKEQGEWQGSQTAKCDNFQYGIVAANPFDRDILKRKDQHTQYQRTNPQKIFIGCFHKLNPEPHRPRSRLVLFVADLFHPVSGFAIEILLNGWETLLY
jgi:hypothetical protein